MSNISSRDEALFADALAQPAAKRGAFLAKACGADAELLARIAALIAAHEGPESLMDSTPMESAAAVHDENPGDVIGHYKLLQKIGEGGCGVVWMAEQEEPVRRRVALKIIKLGMDTKAVVARFEAERQALAMMDHPNIAKVHDAGATETGRPFFVMELVRGIPITKYCDENHLNPTERLELFIKVCQAVQHAHQKGIIHRDLKPSNILVTVNDGAPTPKIIDFGIAKATQGKLTDATVFTAFEQFIGTPVYMSPEQAEMSSLDIDTRSDIYSLGVLLYELLTGRPPFDPKAFAQAGVDEIRKQIREVEPARPSARLRTMTDEEQTTIARLRSTAPSQLSLVLRGDLDWIIMRCLEKDRTRRYDTANGIAMDIQRYLRNEPVIARPPSTAYLLQKLIRRHKVGFAAAAVVAATLVIGSIVSTWQAVRASRAEREQARLRAESDAARDRALSAEEAQRIGAAAAATSRLSAEELLSFVFTDLALRLDDYGLLPELQAINARLVAYYEALPASLQTRDTRAGYAFALAGPDCLGWFSLGLRTDPARLQQSLSIFEELEKTGPLTPFARVAFAGVLGGLSYHYIFEGRELAGVPLIERAEALLAPALTDERWGGWAHAANTYILFAHGHRWSNRSHAREALPYFERALASAAETERRLPQLRRPGLLAARVKGGYSAALYLDEEIGRARNVLSEARAVLRAVVDREPFLATARLWLAQAGNLTAFQAFDVWRFDEIAAANAEREALLAPLLQMDPDNAQIRRYLAGILGGSDPGWFPYHWLMGDHRAAKLQAERAVALLSGFSSIPFLRELLVSCHLNWARASAAMGDEAESERHLAGAEALQVTSTALTAARRQVDFERLNWVALRERAQQAVQQSSDAHGAYRDVMRSSFEMGDFSTARRALDAWKPPTEPQPPKAHLQQRFDRLGHLLLRIHVLARCSENDRGIARSELLRIWPEVDAVVTAGPDYVFNQVQYARALWIRAEIDGTPAEKREWLERGAGYLRPAAAAGKLTRYEREVLLAGIERLLAAPAGR